MAKLPLTVHTGAQVRAMDRFAIDELGIPSYTLMSRAGEGALRTLRSCWPATERILVLCGPGNNAGDGYVLARLAREQALDVRVVAFTPPEKLAGDARRAWEDFANAGGRVTDWNASAAEQVDVIVDAIFGVGLNRPIDGVIADCIEFVSESVVPILSLDIPSGLDADTGTVHGYSIRAERTISFLGLKLGFYLGEGPNCTGVVMCDTLDVPSEALASCEIAAYRIDDDTLERTLPPRRRTTHKGQQGHVLLIGGGVGMPGAARLAGEAALRAGSGLVTVATRRENVGAIASNRPELICRAVENGDELAALFERADVIAIGPGLGQDEWAQSLFAALERCERPAVLDADALNMLARAPRRNHQWILTPHPGEAGRLLGSSSAEVQADRLGAARAICARYGGVVVLKGAGTLVVEEGELPRICDRGNPGMASPGMGDVLTGVIAGILAQGASAAAAAQSGVLAHAMAGDMAAHRGERGMLASDLFNYLPTCVNPKQSR